MALVSRLQLFKTWVFLFTFFASLVGLDSQEDTNERLPRDAMTREQSVSKNLFYLISTHQKTNDGAIPTSFAELDQEGLNALGKYAGRPIKEMFYLVDQKIPLSSDEFRLVFISKESFDIGRSNGAKGRYLAYADAAGNLNHITETNKQLAEWIGDSIPGITFGETADATKAEIRVPESTPHWPPSPVIEESAPNPDIVVASEPEESATVVEPEESPRPAPVEVEEESTPEKPYPIWPWILGVLILIGALSPILTRKKSRS